MILSGRDLPPFFHASGIVVEDIEKHSFDGWYGWGFYAAFNAEYVRRWYGPIVTRIQAKPDAQVLVASITAALAPKGLLEAVLANDLKMTLDGDASKLRDQRGFILENSVQWVHAVDRLAIEKGYGIILFSDEQIVVKPPSDPIILQGEEPSPNADSP
jgi:hypothetical protein